MVIEGVEMERDKEKRASERSEKKKFMRLILIIMYTFDN